MALLAQPKRKVKYGLDPRNTNWASDDSKFGQKLMEKMGWEKGKGLGAKEDGMVEHIKASYKADTRGLGCTPQEADAWIAHQDDFNELLKKLNSKSSTEPEEDKVPEEGRKRFYGRFARGRVKTLRSTEDLDCIMGRRKNSASSTPASQSAANSDEEERKESSLKTVTSSCSVQEYFAKKMKELKARKATNGNSNFSNSLEQDLEASDKKDEDKSAETPVYGAVHFSYGDEGKTESDDKRSRGWYESDGILTVGNDVTNKEKRKKEKKKKKRKACDRDEVEDCEKNNEEGVPKRKKKKCKDTEPVLLPLEIESELVKTTICGTKTDEKIVMPDINDCIRNEKGKKKKKKTKTERDDSPEKDKCSKDDRDDDVGKRKTGVEKRKDIVENHLRDATDGNVKREKRKKKEVIKSDEEPLLETEQKKKKKKVAKHTDKESLIMSASSDVCVRQLEDSVSSEEKVKKKKKKKKTKESDIDEVSEKIHNPEMETSDRCLAVGDETEPLQAKDAKNPKSDDKDKEKKLEMPKHMVNEQKKYQNRKIRKTLSQAFPGSNFGDLEGYRHMDVQRCLMQRSVHRRSGSKRRASDIKK